MSQNARVQYSPLFGIRKLLLTLRWFFGFPVKPTNEEFSEFVFNPCFEIFKYSLYLTCFFLTQSYNSYSFMKLDNSNNLIEITKQYMGKLWGFTVLDILVLMMIPYINLISNTFHLRSFKKTDKSISKICLELTDLNQELEEMLDPSLSMKKRPRIGISLKLFITEFILSFFTMICHCVAVAMMMQEEVITFTNIEKCIWMADCVIMTCCWVYPCVTISADLIVCQILEEMGKTYVSWNTILTAHKENILAEQINSKNHHVRVRTPIQRLLDRYYILYVEKNNISY